VAAWHLFVFSSALKPPNPHPIWPSVFTLLSFRNKLWCSPPYMNLSSKGGLTPFCVKEPMTFPPLGLVLSPNIFYNIFFNSTFAVLRLTSHALLFFPSGWCFLSRRGFTPLPSPTTYSSAPFYYSQSSLLTGWCVATVRRIFLPQPPFTHPPLKVFQNSTVNGGPLPRAFSVLRPPPPPSKQRVTFFKGGSCLSAPVRPSPCPSRAPHITN